MVKKNPVIAIYLRVGSHKQLSNSESKQVSTNILSKTTKHKEK